MSKFPNYYFLQLSFLKFASFLLFILYSNYVSAQQSDTVSIQDCIGAIPVCQKIYAEEEFPLGWGYFQEFENVNLCNPAELHSVWYIFTVNKTGQFGFLLTPNDPNDDYDWVLFNITNASCEDIQTDGASLVVSCNAAGGDGCFGATGATGDTEYWDQGGNCNNFPPSTGLGFSPFNDLIDVEEGNTYVLLINNYLGSANGYTLDFGLSTDIGIFDEVPPELENVQLTGDCNGEELLVRFSEYIKCPTISAANFQLEGPGGPYNLDLIAQPCEVGGDFSKEYFLQIDPPLTSEGDYTLNLIADGQTEVLDICDNPAQPTTFTIAGPGQNGSLNLGNDTTICDGSTVTLDAGRLSGTYLWSDGSTEPTLEVSAGGNYSVTVTTTCSEVADTITVTSISDVPPVDLGPDLELCPGESITLDVTTPNASYLWQDGSTNPTFKVTEAGNYSVMVSNDCGTVTDEINVSFLSEPITATLSDTTLCAGNTITWDVTTPGATYQWQDGSTNPTFTTDAAGDYSVLISTACETVTLQATVTASADVPTIELGNDTVLCEGERLTYDFTSIAMGVTLTWQDGSNSPIYEIDQSGNFSLTAANECGNLTDHINVDYQSPIDPPMDIDTFLCPGQRLILDVTSPNATDYFWQDGTTGPIYAVESTGAYSVSIENSCNEVMAKILISECEICNFFIPNAFSPNGDGINDIFKLETNCDIQDFSMIIFNRWGGMVFEGSNPDLGWNGKYNDQISEEGVYIWMMEIKVEENNKLTTYQLSGDVAILR